MGQKTNELRVFSDTYKMETETVYFQDGKIETYPLPYELGQQITARGGSVKMRGYATVDPDGTACFTPYKSGTGKRYRLLHSTAHGVVMETKEDIFVKLQFRKRLGKFSICDALEDEVDEISEFLELTNEVTDWNNKPSKPRCKKTKNSKNVTKNINLNLNYQ